MKAGIRLLAGSAIALAAFSGATPAAAQYYPGYGGGADIIGQVIGSMIGGGARYGYGGYGSPYGGYGSPYGYGGYGSPYGYSGRFQTSPVQQAAVQQCMGAVQQRLNTSYGSPAGYGYNGYAPYGPRVLGVSEVEPRTNGNGMLVRGVANSGRNAGYGYGNNGQPPVDLLFKCKTDMRGIIVDVDIESAARVNGAYGSGYGYGQPPVEQPYVNQPYGTDYSAYGYRRY